eukprot:2935732-Amphidinium_carterae.1
MVARWQEGRYGASATAGVGATSRWRPPPDKELRVAGTNLGLPIVRPGWSAQRSVTQNNTPLFGRFHLSCRVLFDFGFYRLV